MSRDEWSDRPDSELVAALRAGDEGAFVWLVRRHGRSMQHVARGLVRRDDLAMEVVQETWEAVVKGIDRFRGEASLKTWMFRILVNRAHRVARKEGRTVLLSTFEGDDEGRGDSEPADRFTKEGRWVSPVHGWKFLDPENETLYRQWVALLERELEELPASQRTVVTMRDVEGLEAEEVCELLGISNGNQRVLLHRGRTRLRRALEAAEGSSLFSSAT